MATLQRSMTVAGALCLGMAATNIAHAQLEGLHEMMARNSAIVGTRMLMNHDARGVQVLRY